jgi:hypothetical protein
MLTKQTNMAYELITDYESWNPSEITYGAVKVNSRGGKSVKILDSKKSTLILNTPLIMTWGINEMKDDNTGRVSYNLAIQYPSGNYGTDNSRLFFEKMKEFEDRILNDAVKNSKEWFGKVYTREVLEALYSPVLKYPKVKGTEDLDYSKAPTTRVKIPYWDEKFNVELYDVDRVPLYRPGDALDKPFETFIPKTSQVALVIQCNGFWFIGGKFGISFQMVQAVIRKPLRIQGNCYVKLGSDDMKVVDDLDKKEKKELEEEMDDALVDDVVVESDDDVPVQNTVKEEVREEVKEEVQEETKKDVSEPKPKKKKVVRKKAVAK